MKYALLTPDLTRVVATFSRFRDYLAYVKHPDNREKFIDPNFSPRLFERCGGSVPVELVIDVACLN